MSNKLRWIISTMYDKETKRILLTQKHWCQIFIALNAASSFLFTVHSFTYLAGASSAFFSNFADKCRQIRLSCKGKNSSVLFIYVEAFMP